MPSRSDAGWPGEGKEDVDASTDYRLIRINGHIIGPERAKRVGVR